MTVSASDARLGVPRALAVAGLAALTSWFVGALAWIVEGLQLPISSAWPGFNAAHTPRVALPFGEYEVPNLVTAGLIGGMAAVLISRVPGLVSPALRHPARLPAAIGGALGLAAALAQTWTAVLPAISTRIEGKVLVGALLVAGVGAGAIGLAAGLGLTSHRPWPRMGGGALGAAFAVHWVTALASALTPSFDTNPVSSAIVATAPWVGGLLLGLALGTFGLRPPVRALGWLLAAVLLWVVPALFTATMYAAAYARSGSLSGGGSELADAARDVLVGALHAEAARWMPLALALLLGSVVAGVRARRPSS